MILDNVSIPENIQLNHDKLLYKPAHIQLYPGLCGIWIESPVCALIVTDKCAQLYWCIAIDRL